MVIYTETEGTELLTKNGKVVGAKAEKADGTPITIIAVGADPKLLRSVGPDTVGHGALQGGGGGHHLGHAQIHGVSADGHGQAPCGSGPTPIPPRRPGSWT